MLFCDQPDPGHRTCGGLPGGEEITFDFYVLPAVEACLNQKHIIRRVNAILDEDIPPHDRVSFYYTLKVTLKDGQYHATVSFPMPISTVPLLNITGISS